MGPVEACLTIKVVYGITRLPRLLFVIMIPSSFRHACGVNLDDSKLTHLIHTAMGVPAL